MFKKDALKPWKSSLFIVFPTCIITWLGGGVLLSTSFFDKHFFNTYKVLTLKTDTLTFVTAIFALFIPIFILLFQGMISAGYMNRYILPRIIKYREILTGYFVLTLLLLISPRAAFYYVPIVGIVIFSVLAALYSLLVLFDMAYLKDSIECYVHNIVKSYFGNGLKNRQLNNSFLEQLKTTSWVKHSWLEYPLHNRNQNKAIEIRSLKNGYLRDINIKKLDNLMLQEFSELKLQKDANTSIDANVLPRLILSVRPGSNIEDSSVIMTLIIPEDARIPAKDFTSKLQKTLDIISGYTDTTAAALSDLKTGFKQQLRDAIDSDNVILVQQALDFYKLLLEGLDKFSAEQGDDIYELADARQEYRSFWTDDMSKELQEISQMIDDEFIHSLRDAKQETSRELTGFMYRDLLAVSEGSDVLAIARADHSFSNAISSIIYSEYITTNIPTFQKQIIDKLLFRLKEHTDLLVYYLAEETEKREGDRHMLEDWLRLRIGDVRDFLLATYKNSQIEIFKLLLDVFKKIHDDIYTYPESTEKVLMEVNCTLFIILAYMSGRNSENDEQKESHQLLDAIINSWSPTLLTQVLVRCIDEKYVYTWRVDTFDLVADGEMHDVPDFSAKLKTTWAEKMLLFEAVPQNIDNYKETPIGSTLTFYQGQEAKDNFLLNYFEASENSHAVQLKTLTESFIAVRQDWETNQLATMPLNEKKVSEVVDTILKSYKENSISYSIFQQPRSLEGCVSANGQFKYVGWNELKDKAAFVDNWYMGYYLPADQYGSDIAKHEDSYVFEELFKNAERLDKKHLLSTLRRKSQDTWFILLVNTGSWYLRQLFDGDLEPDHVYTDVRFKKVQQRAAVKMIYNDKMNPGLYAVKSKDLGKLKFKQPVDHPVEVNISAYSHDTKLRSTILASPPEWLQEKGDRNAQEAFLKTKARLFVSHVMRYMPKDNVKTYYLPLEEDY